jgi:DNA replication and repair protein RecF
VSEDWCAHAVRIADVRCWSRLELSLRPGLILVWGPNGAGKTSLVEAISLACIGASPRTSREAEVVRHGAEAAHVELELSGPGGAHTRGIGYAPGRGRRLTVDGTPVRALADWTAPGAVLIFVPDELRIVKGPPAARRRHLDRLLEAAVPGYRQASAEYRHAVSQRNALLRRVRSQEASPAELSPWERQLVPRAAEVIRARRAAMGDLSEPFRRWLAALGGGEEGAVHLETSPSSLADVPDADLEAALQDALDARRPRDIAAAQTLSGPHRDDVSIRAGALDLRTSGSQGEQRTAALALTLSHRDVLTAAVARPILLLDDALSELDPERRARVLQAVTEGGQALITTADPAAAAEAGALSAQVLQVHEGTVSPE